MAVVAVSLVISSALVHALWNLFAKQSLDKVTFLFSIHIINFIILLPYSVIEIQQVVLDGPGIIFLLGSMFFQVIYGFSLIRGYTVGELSLVYPILRGSASLLIPLISVLFLGDHLTILGWVGLLLVVTGIFLMGSEGFKSGEKVGPSLLYALAGGMAITGYTLSDKMLLDYISPFLLIQFQNFIHIIALLWPAVGSQKLKQEWVLNWKIIIMGAFFVPGAYTLFLFAMKLANVAQLAPMREISIVFGAILGALILKEKQGVRKALFSILIVIGIVILSIFG
ncbi:EamA family transporter [Bacillus piscicola]|uniref:EamA family transporter n=1 Tax=Bacillus piscicola TaxID=1632684 RepID=UPI001F099AEF